VKNGKEAGVKRLLQVRWEGGFIDSTTLKKYTLTGKRELGIGKILNNLTHIMGMCAVFK
jgi:hypothetical protein